MNLSRSFKRSAIATLAAGLCAAIALPAHAATPRSHQHAAESIVLYSSQGYDSAMSKAFPKVSGIGVKLTDDSTGPLVARITAERNNPKWDVVWFDGDATMQSLDDQGLLYKWTSPDIKNYTALGASLVPADHAFYPTGATAAGVMVYNTHKLTPAQAPRDWSDLLKPQFKNGVAENDPAYSGPAFPLIAGMMKRLGGLSQGEAYYRKLKANGLKIYQTNDPTIHSVETGATLVGIVQDSAYYALKATGAPVGVVYARSGVTVLPGVVAINARSKHLKAAEAFVNYILSMAGQNVMVHDPGDSDSYFTPIIGGVTALKGRQTTGIMYQRLDSHWAATNETAIKTWFHANIVQ